MSRDLNSEAEALRARNQELERLLFEREAEVEAARREAEIEAALERVRARSMAMQDPGELAEVALVMFEQLKDLGLQADQCWIALFSEGDEWAETWLTAFGKASIHPRHIKVPLTGIPALEEKMVEWRRGEPFMSAVFTGDEVKAWLNALYAVTRDPMFGRGPIPDYQEQSLARHKYGVLATASSEPVNAESKTILLRFARVFEQTYTRFLDLKKAGEQAREIERGYRQLETAHRDLEQAHLHLKTTQQKLIHAEKMASLGQLTAVVAHEIKNPLNFINNFAEINEGLALELREALANGEDIEDLLADLEQNASVIAQHGKRADCIVQSMMHHASGSTGEHRKTDLNALIEERINLVYHSRQAQQPGFSCEIVRDYDEAIGLVDLAPQEIGRLLLNLLDNAFDAVHKQAAEAGGDFIPSVILSTRRADKQVEIRITDNGPGIPVEIQERIFEPFFSTKPTGAGTGLGLSLSYDIVTQGHGGTLIVESTTGEGATFTISLPC